MRENRDTQISRGTPFAGSKTVMEGPNAENKTGSEGKQRRVYSIPAPQQAALEWNDLCDGLQEDELEDYDLNLERVLKVLHGETSQQQQRAEEPESRAEEAMVKKLAAIPEVEKTQHSSKRTV
jgi:hypothetical protein